MACTFTLKFLVFFFIFFIFSCLVYCKKEVKTKENTDADKWKKKNLQDYSDADIERLYDQWEDADEDELEEDELPEWKREPPKVDMSKLDTSDPENLLKTTKKGRTLMMFATVTGNPAQPETEKVTQIWQGSLFNANIETQRYVVGENRVIFMLKDGAMAWEVKDFLVQQDRCEEVTIEGKSYPGKGASKDAKTDKKSSKKKDSKDTKETKDAKKTKKKNENDKKSKSSNTSENKKKQNKKTEL